MLLLPIQGPCGLAFHYFSRLDPGVSPLTLIPRPTLCRDALPAPSLPANPTHPFTFSDLLEPIPPHPTCLSHSPQHFQPIPLVALPLIARHQLPAPNSSLVLGMPTSCTFTPLSPRPLLFPLPECSSSSSLLHKLLLIPEDLTQNVTSFLKSWLILLINQDSTGCKKKKSSSRWLEQRGEHACSYD